MQYRYDIRTGATRIKTHTKKLMVGAVALAMPAVMVLSLGAASAAGGYSLFGDAQLVSPGNASPKAVQLRSDATPGWGGVNYGVPAGTTFADFTTLATDYKFEVDDSCAAGSPRFQINVESPDTTDTGNIFVYIGPPPNYTLCPPNVWLNTGDLLEGINPIDTSQLNAGTFYDPYSAALVKYSGYKVTGVQLVVDSNFAFSDGEQTAFADNTNVDGMVYTYDQPSSKDECKKDGWMALTDQSGNAFKNQGQCVSWTNGRGQ